ncbi:hypothetical protein [Aureimonas sp. SK2]|uniref:hypothetical protein n=1 Tax=Aureimonas sp. SK2 TaxID=3015992 RepID=UPI0024445D95|nr:hypothetical protein [Aureimonas sp. SK2]
MQGRDLPAYRFTAKLAKHGGGFDWIETAFEIAFEGLSVERNGRVRVIPWAAFRFLHLHHTSGVGTTGFPVYSARLRTLWSTRDISSVDWQGDTAIDRSGEYVRFMEALIPFAAARNPKLRLRYAGDPMLEAMVPLIVAIFLIPFLIIPMLVFKPLGAFLGAFKKGFGKLIFAGITGAVGLGMNAFPWSSGKPFEAGDLPVTELPPRYREGVASTSDERSEASYGDASRCWHD